MQDLDLQAVSQRMNLIATEQQEEVTKTRQPPIGNIWNRFPHTLRDLAHNCGEEARLEMEGKTPNSTAYMQDRGPIIPWVRLSQVLPTAAQSAFRQTAEVAVVVKRGRLLHELEHLVGSSRVDLQACKLEYSIVSPK